MISKLCSALLILFLLGQIASCGEASPNDGSPVSQETLNANSSASKSDKKVTEDSADDLPDTDLGGYNFRILAFANLGLEGIWADTQNGSMLNDAVYSKIKTVEERFNCKITLAKGSDTGTAGSSSAGNIVSSAILSGDDSFDLTLGHDLTLATMALEGNFINVYDIPYLNLNKPWWPKYTVESLSLGKQMYLFSSSIAYNAMAGIRVMYFNKTLFENMKLDMPYDSVRDGSWTLNKLNSMTKQGYRDLNGNSQVDIEDQFGIINPSYFYCVLEPFNLEPYCDDGNGRLTYNFDLDKYQTLTEKLYSLFIGDGGYLTPTGPDCYKVFAEGRAMFHYGQLELAGNQYNESGVIYGILPMPKLDENQEEYYSGCTDRPLAVPVTASEHLDKTGLVIEALSAEGYRQVFPAYFEKSLKVRYADQTDDADMIDIIYNNVILSFTYIYGSNSPYNNMLQKLFCGSTPNTDVSSYAASIEGEQQARVNEIMNTFERIK